MKQLSLLLKPAGSLCDLSCRYCFYRTLADSRNCQTQEMMKEDVVDAIITNVFDELDVDGSVHFAFQGGEPTLVGLAFFQQFVQKVNDKKKQQTIRYSLQSNGLHFDEEWVKFLKEKRFLVGLSIDGYEKNHTSFRVHDNGKSTYFKSLQSYEMLRKAGIAVNVLTVLTEELAKHPKALYQYYKDHHIEYIQLIPCMDHGSLKHQLGITPKTYATFYIAFFKEWFQEYEQGGRRSISLCDNLQLMLLDQLPFTCGMIGRCAFQTVIESNGDVYPCDFYADDRHHCGNVLHHSFIELRKSTIVESFLKKEESKICLTCDMRRFCYGNCKGKRSCFLDEQGGYCGYREVLSVVVPMLYHVVQGL